MFAIGVKKQNSDISLGVHAWMGLKGTNSALEKSSNIPEIYAEMFDRFH